MICKNCLNYKSISNEGFTCGLADAGNISEIDNEICLLRCQISLLRAIYEELVDLNSNFIDGDNWKV